MAVRIREQKIDHRGNELAPDIYACVRQDNDTIVGFKVRWREEDEDGIQRHPGKSFSGRAHGSLDRALEAAGNFLAGARKAVEADGSVARPDTAASMTIEELFREWIVKRGAEIQLETAENVIRLWDREIAPRSMAKVRLDQLSRDPSILTRFQTALKAEGMKPSKRRELLKWLRAVLRWGRRQHPKALTVELSGLFELPKQKKTRLPFAADAIGLERIIEAILKRPARDDLLPLRDAAFVGALGYTIASRPSEWRRSVTWDDLFAPSADTGIGTVELQQLNIDEELESISGLKTGAHVCLLLPNGWDRILTYREALEDRFGAQPGHGLVFQVLDEDGPVWVPSTEDETPLPLAMNKNDYNRWTARVWRPARDIAAKAPDAPAGLERMTFYDCRHTAISMALHSTLVVGPLGMNLHPLSQWAAHDIQTLQRYYSHIIARYYRQEPIDIVAEVRRARAAVAANPFDPDEQPGPQRKAQRRRRARAVEKVSRQAKPKKTVRSEPGALAATSA